MFIEFQSLVFANTYPSASPSLRPEKKPRTERLKPCRWYPRPRTNIHSLNNDVLLEVFDWYFANTPLARGALRQTSSVLSFRAALQVCRTWRHLVLGSPNRLNLTLNIKRGSPASELLTHFPLLPVTLDYRTKDRSMDPKGVEGTLRGMVHPRRMRCIKLTAPAPEMRGMLAVMDSHFPMLESLEISAEDPPERRVPGETKPLNLPPSFSAPRLAVLELGGIAPPVEPDSSLSARFPVLVYLWLSDILSTIQLPPEYIVDIISSMPLLTDLGIHFRHQRNNCSESCGIGRAAKRVQTKRTPQLSLRCLTFKGSCKYFDNLASRISAPSLQHLDVTFYNQLSFALPSIMSFDGARSIVEAAPSTSILFEPGYVQIAPLMGDDRRKPWSFVVLSTQFDWQVASAAEICEALSPALHTASTLELTPRDSDATPPWQAEGRPEDWQDLLRPFRNVKTLRVYPALCHELSRSLMSGGTEASLELLPELQTLELWEWVEDERAMSTDLVEAPARVKRPIAIQQWRDDLYLLSHLKIVVCVRKRIEPLYVYVRISAGSELCCMLALGGQAESDM
ncbi:hypothetical protein BC834DRAFT_304452 [Gloeopeniophorella convolvens]|nr:hypothetical protein BC834DRAFT_304452 [Gloeopeniophorella convolvens]